eukprot:2862487-Prymnesium_polylepis.1
MEAGTTEQSTTEAARTTKRSTLTIAQLRVGGAGNRGHVVRITWRTGLREDRATFPSPRRQVVAVPMTPSRSGFHVTGGRHGGNGRG